MTFTTGLLLRSRKPSIEIILPEKDFYITHDRIEGLATIVAPCNTQFTSVSVNFVGNSKTYLDRSITLALDQRTQGTHQFLRLRQPDVSASLPQDGILRAGQQYRVPFEFVIPVGLLPHVCRHHKDSECVGRSHLQLPPSLSDGNKRVDSLAPMMADIQYGIAVQILKSGDVDMTVVASNFHTVWLLPDTTYNPSVYQTLGAEEFKTQVGKLLRRTSLARHKGFIVATSPEPCFLNLTEPNTTFGFVTVELSFRQPHGETQNDQQPAVGRISTMLKGTTYFASTARSKFPSRATWISDPQQGIYTNYIKLATLSSPKVDWLHHDITRCYSASIQVPIRLPSSKSIAPTFHSCLISRTYSIQMRIKVKASGSCTDLDLDVPAQIVCEGIYGDKKFFRTDDEMDVELFDYADPAPMYTE